MADQVEDNCQIDRSVLYERDNNGIRSLLKFINAESAQPVFQTDYREKIGNFTGE